MKDTSRIAPFATFKENLPSISDIVPVVPPLTAILAPITGSPHCLLRHQTLSNFVAE